MRRAAKIDRNQPEIVDALRACGCEVESLAAVGHGVADLLVFHRPSRRLMLVEVKDGARRPSERRLTADQVEWHTRWPVRLVVSVDEALATLHPFEALK